ncbi:hypothetical protein P9112_007467 [Eukaryota sp. TZLM1-RC]
MSLCSRFVVHESQNDILIYPLDPLPPLGIDRDTAAISQFNDIEQPPRSYGHEILGILGLITINSYSFIITVTSANVVAQIGHHEIWLIESINTLPLRTYTSTSFHTAHSLCKTAYSERGLYFSPSLPLSLPLSSSLYTSSPIWSCSDSSFVFNNFAAATFLSSCSSDLSSYVLPVTQGYFGMVPRAILCGDVYHSLCLFSRRDVSNLGKRFTRRGVDFNHSHTPANTVITEQSIISDCGRSLIGSYILMRGSIPLQWSQTPDLTLKPSIKMIENDWNDCDVFRSVVEDLQRSFGKPLVFVNLINQKGHEGDLCRAFENLIDETNIDGFSYYYFDFHKECCGFQYQKVASLVESISSELSWNMAEKVQKGIVRVNCIDCLDRTNVVQSFLSRFVLHRQLHSIGSLSVNNITSINQTRGDLSYSGTCKFDKDLEAAFSNLWANNGDELSLQYAGTFAMKRDFLRKGKRTFTGTLFDGYLSISRFILNNFSHGHVQDALDLVIRGRKGEVVGQQKSRFLSCGIWSMLLFLVTGMVFLRRSPVKMVLFIVFVSFLFKYAKRKYFSRFVVKPRLCFNKIN